MTVDPFAIGPLAGISSMATRQVLAELADEYERHSSRRVRIESVGGVDAVRRILEGEPFDVVVLAADAIERLASAGCVDPGSRTDLARSGIAVAVRAGAPHPEIGSQAALREALLTARSIGYSTGPSGVHLLSLFGHLGIAEALAPRAVQAPSGVAVGTLVARGEVELGFQQLSELIHLPGIDVVGPLPPGAQQITVFSAAVCAGSARSADAKDWLTFLASLGAGPVIRRNGMEPVNS
ncbi:substrate-binding domain-containing protein [Trinickia dinghuensis]|uniref:ABC transporter substrate-binding protein n=1 Tax=Trinickia dinghuensis TaxID=2291023 RepID=A0A3D8JU10_9BURK|nr:substrate-binding domain-containing protein [Trinickia dinghuensis]RDU95871.1 ABC transporter substrate-binding protein [Trinickia dinghuensis]